MEEIYKEYAKKVYNYLLSLTNDEMLSEELLQETFFSAIKNINKFRAESSIKTWLYSIAKNKWIDYQKKLQKTKNVVINENLIDDSLPEEDYLIKNDLLNICKKIHKLDEKSKEVIYLRMVGNLNFIEIGEILGKTPNWARVTFYRKKKKIREVNENGKKN